MICMGGMMKMNEKKTLTAVELREGLSEELGARVRELRRRKGLRQTGLAELIGCSNEQISNIENPDRAGAEEIGEYDDLGNDYKSRVSQ